MISGAALLAIFLTAAVAPSPEAPGTKLTLRNGTVYLLKEPPRITGTRVVFTTTDGQLLSLDESEIQSIGSVPAPTPPPRRYDQEDSRALGAIARQQRDAKGRRAEVAPRAASRKRAAAAKPGPSKAKGAKAKVKTKTNMKAKPATGVKPAPTPSPSAR